MASSSMMRYVSAAVCLLLASVGSSQELVFEKDIRPILKQHCFHCHGEQGEKEGALDVRLRRFLIKGGEAGTALIPGDPDGSLLVSRISKGEMPPGEKKVTARELQKIREWVAQGAPTARDEPLALDQEYFTEEERSHWAFQPIRRPSVPALNNELVFNEVDAFILQKLSETGLTPSPVADRHTLLRRMTYDLWGLPPEPEMIAAFEADQSPQAYARLIDRLLASPRYGERWGRHWLDVAGYADSDGYAEQDLEREFAYFYRDYVIDSLNANKPFSQFIIEQLAGDELAEETTPGTDLPPERISQLAATGFLRNAPDGTGVGGVDRAVAANETIAETINIVSTSLLGLTVGCARCHDHRYDPISQKDYYRFRAIFDPALDWKAWQTPSQRQRSLYTAADREERERIKQQADAAEQQRLAIQKEHLDRTLAEELLVAPDDRRDALRTAYQTPKDKRSPEQIALLEEFPNIGNISPGSLYLYAEQRVRRSKGIEKAAEEREAKYRELAKAESRESLTEEQQAELEMYRESAKRCRETDAKTDLAKRAEEVKNIRASAPKEYFLRVLTEPKNHTPDSFLFVRGDHQQPSGKVEPGEFQVLAAFVKSPIPSDEPSLPTTGRRLAYAKHLTSDSHPLVARVIMNRVWLHHFGSGLVPTAGDFGMLGAAPTHPELLDWLASEFIQSGWNLKAMHRRMMLSRTYMQMSQRNSQLDRVDPNNQWLARMSVRRLDAEEVRDSILSISHDLLDTMHGPPVPVKEDAVGQIILGKEMLDGERKPSNQEERFAGVARRSVYVQVRRSRPLAVLETFDLPSLTPNCTQRNASNVALQSLMLMNSQFALEHSERMADRLIAHAPDRATQLALAWQLAYGKPINEASQSQLIAFMDSQVSQLQSLNPKQSLESVNRIALASLCHVLMSSNGFLYVD